MFDERVTAGSRLLFVLILSRSLRPGIHVPSIHTTDMHTHRRCPSNTSHRCAPAHTPSRTHPLLAEPICVCVSFKVCMRVCVCSCTATALLDLSWMSASFETHSLSHSTPALGSLEFTESFSTRLSPSKLVPVFFWL